MKSPDDGKPESWHRFFGAGANNAAWTLVELPIGDFDKRELLDAAHAAAWHWHQVGTELQRMRALALLALAHARTGLGPTAMAYADDVRAYFLSRPGTPDWEVAFTHVTQAFAASAAGDRESHARSHAAAEQAIAALATDEDRDVVQRVFRHVPRP